ncbi:maleylpyruvate isomerase family mycothiol-dependent enzyme [Kutzneria sp. NPDC052558]|uniref:maleylpyruvate isomerase family mycothiol-dependent enzyme n=1 Tax=Kutzneria sp. NPDC052558 TaxID=3364121 RepID=UPI0037CB34C0
MDHLGIARLETERFIAAATRVPPSAAVPACPGWTVAELVAHVVGLARGAGWYIRTGSPSPPTPAQIADWFAPYDLDELRRVDDVLATAQPGPRCWTVWPSASPLEFWSRRHAHELTIHRVDLELAAGLPVTEPDEAFAADGIDELATYLRRVRGLDVWPTDDGVRFEGRLIAGPPATLYLQLWNRIPGAPASWRDRAKWTFG